MTNQNTTTIVATQAEISSTQPTSINYAELVKAAQTGDTQAMGDLMTRLQRMHADVREWLNDKANKNKPAGYYTSEMYAILENRLDGIQRGNFKVSDAAAWAMFLDHQVTTRPTMERFSTYDWAQLSRGRYLYPDGKKTWIQGIQTLSHLPNYGILGATNTGWQLSLNGVDYQFTAEQAFELIKGNIRKLLQAMPFDRKVVMDGHRTEKQTPNGISVVLPEGLSFKDKSGTLYTLRELTRVSMTHTDFKWLMWPVAFFRYKQDDEKGTFCFLASILKAALGEFRIPANRIEVDYCQICSWFPQKSAEQQVEYLRPGRFLFGHHLEILGEHGEVVEPSDFHSLETYIASLKRKDQARVEAAQRKQEPTPITPKVEEVDPFLPNFDLKDDIP